MSDRRERDGVAVPSVIAALDIGTNSFHLVVARHTGGEGVDVLTRENEMIRLGHGGTDMKELAPEGMLDAGAGLPVPELGAGGAV